MSFKNVLSSWLKLVARIQGDDNENASASNEEIVQNDQVENIYEGVENSNAANEGETLLAEIEENDLRNVTQQENRNLNEENPIQLSAEKITQIICNLETERAEQAEVIPHINFNLETEQNVLQEVWTNLSNDEMNVLDEILNQLTTESLMEAEEHSASSASGDRAFSNAIELNQEGSKNDSNQEGSKNELNQEGSGDSSDFYSFSHKIFRRNGSLKIFENEFFEVVIRKSYHKTERKFKLQDSIFNVKIKLKNQLLAPMLKDILDVLEKIITFCLTNLKSFVDLTHENICFITFLQDPMIRGIKSVPFNLNEDAAKGTANLLSQLNSFLVSNNELTLNESFILKIDILSLTHAEMLKKVNKRKVHYGAKSDKSDHHSYWSLDVSFDLAKKFPILINKCLLICCILADLQFKYYLSGKKNLRYIYAQNFHSELLNKQSQAISILTSEINKFMIKNDATQDDFTEGLDFEKWKDKLKNYFNCQIVIFSGKELGSKILLMHPEQYDMSLKQFYFYSPLEASNHVTFIRHVNSYFKENSQICLQCKKSFKSHLYLHLCKEKETCFSCRLPFQNANTFICPILQDKFCDSLISNLTSDQECEKCNLISKTSLCFKNHKKVCKQGLLGYLCKRCNSFTYCNGTNYKNSEQIKKLHQCADKFCRKCKTYYNYNESQVHICKLRKEFLKNSNDSLAFLSYSSLSSSSYNCPQCFVEQMDYIKKMNISWKDLYLDPNFSSLLCVNHKTNWFLFELNGLCVYQQTSTRTITKYELTSFSSLSSEDFEIGQEMSYRKPNLIKLSSDFVAIVNKFEKLDSLLLIDNFLKLIMKQSWSNTTIILSDPFGFFLKHLTARLIYHGICPKFINDVGKVILLEITQLKLRFITTEMYQFNSAFDTEVKKLYQVQDHFFPSLFNQERNFDYEGSIPDIKFFTELSDSTELIESKKKFIETKLLLKWNFRKELIENLNYKCLLLTLGSLTFIKESFNLQKKLSNSLPSENLNKNKLLNPFNNSLCSYSSYIFKLFRSYYLFEEEIFSVHDEYGTLKKNCSMDEILWAQFMTFQFPQKKFRHNFNHCRGQKYFKECIPDLFSPITGECWFFMGCYWHGHLADKCLNPSSSQYNNCLKKSYKTLNTEFENKIKQFKLKNPTFEVHCEWECHFKERKKTIPFSRFKNHFITEHPLVRLRPRTTVRGGYNQIYRFAWNKKDHPNESFFCIDINGLYSYCAIKFPTNYGSYEILIGEEIEKIEIQNNLFFYNSKKIYGAIQLMILAPQNLFLPFLMYRIKNEKNVLSLCRTCSENNLSNTFKKCNHNDHQRAFISCYLIEEIEFALKLGYKIMKIYEIHCYYEKKHILSDFVRSIDSLKCKFSNYSKSSLTKSQICDQINLELDLPNEFKLKSDELENNSFKKHLYKITNNALFGKLQQRTDYSKTIFVASQEELEEMYRKYGVDIQNITCHNNSICQVDYYEKPNSKFSNLNGNCYLGAEITANARITMYKYLTQLHFLDGITLYYCDTDSIFGSIKNSVQLPVTIGHAVGQFKHVIEGQILSFYCLGLKNYSITYINEEGIKQQMTKLCGLNLKNNNTNSEISDILYESYIEKFFNNITETLVVPNMKRPKQEHLNHLETFTFSNNISSDRKIKKNLRLSFPSGYVLL